MDKKINTLVVDNNPVLLKLISTLLQRENCTVETAENGLHAIEILEEFRPDIVFTDLIMPQVSGEQLCKILRRTKKFRDVFIVVLSATVLEDSDRIFRETDCDLCIAKGNLNEIRNHLRDALKEYRGENGKNRRNYEKTEKDARIPKGLRPSEVTTELLLEKRHLDKILDNLVEGIIELNAEGKVVSANRAALEIIDLGEEKIIGVVLSEICSWGSFQAEIADWIQKNLIDRRLESLEIIEKNPLELNDRILTVSFVPISDKPPCPDPAAQPQKANENPDCGNTTLSQGLSDKENVFGLCILRDITRQFRAEKERRELDNAVRLITKMDAMSLMAGGVAHDFNNLLTVICGNLDIVVARGETLDSSEREQLIQYAQKAALVAVDLTRQISCFSNFGIVSREKVHIRTLIENSLQEFAEHTPIDYEFEVRHDQCFVYVDPEEIAGAMGNVLQNALEATDSGTIRVVVDHEISDQRRLIQGQYVPAGRYARIDIKDCGRGIDKENLFRVFDPYYSTKERSSLKGMGMGLTIVYATLRNHGGYVVVHSAPSEGTMVSLYIPELLQSTDRLDLPVEKILNGLQLLMIEPDMQMAQIGKIMLEHLGVIVKTAGTRREALEYVQEEKKQGFSGHHVVLLDLSVEQGGAAENTCRLLLKVEPNLKIIATSGTILDPVMEDCRKHGFIGALPKPYNMDSLKHAIISAIYS
ncbi:response regulator [Desulfomarina sp.]